MYYASKVNEDRIKVVMQGRIVYMTMEEYAQWTAAIAWGKRDGE